MYPSRSAATTTNIQRPCATCLELFQETRHQARTRTLRMAKYGFQEGGRSYPSYQTWPNWHVTWYVHIFSQPWFPEGPGRFFSKFLHQLQEVWPAYSEEAFRWDRAVQGSLVGRLRDPGPGVYNIALLCVHMFQYSVSCLEFCLM